MSTGNTISGTFGVDISNLKKDMADAANVAKTGGANVERTLKASAARASQALSRVSPVNWNNVLAQSGGMNSAAAERVRRNSAAGFSPAPPGKYPSPSDDGSGGRGDVPKGVGRSLTLVSGLAAFAGFFEKVNQEADQLRSEIAEITKLTGAGAFRGFGEMEGNINTSASKLREITDRTAVEKQNLAGRGAAGPAGAMGAIIPSAIRMGRQLLTGDSDTREEEEKTRLREQVKRDLGDMAQRQTMLNDAEREGLSGSEQAAKLKEAELHNVEKLQAISRLEAATGVPSEAKAPENDRYGMEVEAIKKVASLRQAEAQSTIRIGLLERTGLTATQQTVAALKEKLGLKNKELAMPMTNERRDALSGERIGIENQLNKANYANRFDGPALYTPEKGEAAKYSSYIKSQTASNPNAYITNPDAYARSPDAYGGPNDPVPQGGRGYQSPTFSSNLGDLAKPMPKFGGSDSFNDWFHPQPGAPGADAAAGSDKGSGGGDQKPPDFDALTTAINAAVSALKGE